MYDEYVMTDDDNILNLEEKFNTSLDFLKKINGDINMTSGTNILVPKNSFDYYTVESGDTLYKVANDNNINPSLLAELNGLNLDDYIYPNQVLLVPRAGTIIYITAIGDTLSEVAMGLNIDLAELLKQNNKIYLQPEQLIVYKYK